MDFEFWRTIKYYQTKMIKDRGFPISEKTFAQLRDVEWFSEHYGRMAEENECPLVHTLTETYETDTNILHAVYLNSEQGLKHISKAEFSTEFYNKFHETELCAKKIGFLFISDIDVSSDAKKDIKTKIADIQFFLTKELRYDKTEHVLYSPHIVMSSEEVSEKFKTTDIVHLQKMRRETDGMAKYFNYPPGTIVKIVCHDWFLSTPTSVYANYRRVV